MSETSKHEPEIDGISGVETTGHEWDGIKELNNPLPRWWLWTFYACIIWAIGYAILYPSIPLINAATPGLLGYSSRANVAADIAEAKVDQADILQQIANSELSDIIGNPELARFARSGGQAAFKVNCSQCHGSGAQGAAGFPNLNDDEWIWGGTPEDIYTTIASGVRYEENPDTRFNQMPAFGDDDLLPIDEIRAVSRYVAYLGDLEGGENSAQGAMIFEENCAACHGSKGVGEPALGGPPLDNAITLFAGDYQAILAQVRSPQQGVMPAWSGKLEDTTIKQLAVYVHSLGGGQ